MDLVYVLGNGSRWKDREIQYSLRSVEKYIPDAGKVFIATETLPAFLNPNQVIHVRARDGNSLRTMNTLHKALKACDDDRLSETFLFLNDDMIFLKPPVGYMPSARGRLEQAPGIVNKKSNEYTKAARNTLAILRDLGTESPLNFATHRPTPIHRREFAALMTPYFDRYEPVLWMTLYLHLSGATYRETPDAKAHSAAQFMNFVSGDDMVSLSDKCVRDSGVRAWLQNRFPNPSKYEVA